MTDERYWHRRTVAELHQAHCDLHQLRTEFERVSTGLNEAVADANRWHDAYERLVDERDAECVRARDAQTARETAENRADEAEAEVRRWHKHATRVTDIEHDRDEWKTQAETWEENHQILSEHYRRMVDDRDNWRKIAATESRKWSEAGARAEEAEERVRDHSDEIERLVVRAVDAETRAERAETLLKGSTDLVEYARDRLRLEVARADDAKTRPDPDSIAGWQQRINEAETRAETAEANRNHWFALAQLDSRDDCGGCDEAELERHAAEQRAAAWWELAKDLCRRRNANARIVSGLSSALVAEWNEQGYIT